jgi:hypothetical protein
MIGLSAIRRIHDRPIVITTPIKESLPQARRPVLPEPIGSQAQPSEQLQIDFFTIAPLVM